MDSELWRGAFLNKGSHGKIYMSDNNCVVKIVEWFSKKEQIIEPTSIRELCIHSKLLHPNVVPLLAYRVEGNILLLKMPFRKLTLHKWIGLVKNNDYQRKYQVAEGIARGLAYMHRSGFVHRDVKGDNILIDNDNVPQLCDFGLSNMISSHLDAPPQTEGGSIQTVYWRSPECVMNLPPFGPPIDVWSFGVILYQMFSESGKSWPFSDDSSVNNLILMFSTLPKITCNHEEHTSSEIGYLCHPLQIERIYLEATKRCHDNSKELAVLEKLYVQNEQETLARKEQSKKLFSSIIHRGAKKIIKACFTLNPQLRPAIGDLFELEEKKPEVKEEVISVSFDDYPELRAARRKFVLFFSDYVMFFADNQDDILYIYRSQILHQTLRTLYEFAKEKRMKNKMTYPVKTLLSFAVVIVYMCVQTFPRRDCSIPSISTMKKMLMLTKERLEIHDFFGQAQQVLHVTPLALTNVYCYSFDANRNKFWETSLLFHYCDETATLSHKTMMKMMENKLELTIVMQKDAGRLLKKINGLLFLKRRLKKCQSEQ